MVILEAVKSWYPKHVSTLRQVPGSCFLQVTASTGLSAVERIVTDWLGAGWHQANLALSFNYHGNPSSGKMLQD